MLWAFSEMSAHQTAEAQGQMLGVVQTLLPMATELTSRMNAHDIANVIFALARLGVTDQALVDGLLTQMPEVLPALQPQQLSIVCWSLSKLRLRCATGVHMTGVVQQLCGCVESALPEMHAQSLGMLAWGIGALDCTELTSCLVEPLVARASDLVGEMTYQTIAHLDYCVRQLQAPEKDLHSQWPELFAKLGDQCNESLLSINQASTEANQEAANKMALVISGTEATGKVLLVDDADCRLAQKLKQLKSPLAITHWHRFNCGEREGLSWPKGAKYKWCAIRAPISNESCIMAIKAVTPLLEEGGTLWLYKAGAIGASRLGLKKLFDKVGIVSRAAGVCVLQAIRKPSNATDEESSLKQWQTTSTVQLPDSKGHDQQPQSWVTYPGLFAGGLLDVMTASMLHHMSKPGSDHSVLDYCCGSGAIAAALRSWNGSTKLHLLDADAVALDAARINVPDATHYLSDGWTNISEELKFDWIVSNPPVHSGKHDDFAVLQALIVGSVPRLKSGGKLFIVAQNHIPVGVMMRCGAPEAVWASITMQSDGRFSTWCAVLTDCILPTKPNKEETPSEGTKRKRDADPTFKEAKKDKTDKKLKKVEEDEVEDEEEQSPKKEKKSKKEKKLKKVEEDEVEDEEEQSPKKAKKSKKEKKQKKVEEEEEGQETPKKKKNIAAEEEQDESESEDAEDAEEAKLLAQLEAVRARKAAKKAAAKSCSESVDETPKKRAKKENKEKNKAS